MRWAYTTAFLALASAAVRLYWTVGGTALLDTVGGEIDPSGDVDEHALRRHVFVWDLWFFVWGVALAASSAPNIKRV
jgi:hypothetical protein